VPLNDRQRRFVEEITKGNSATQAYIAAGYSARGAEVSASQLLRNPKVAAELAAVRAKAAENVGLTLEAHLTRLNELAFAAAKAEQYSAAVTAETNRGKAAGLYIDKVEDVTKLAPEEREKRVLTLLGAARQRKLG